MNKEIKKLIGEIIFLSILIVTIIPLFNGLREDNLKRTSAILSYANDLSISIDNDKNNKLLYPMTDEYARSETDKEVITISNMSNSKTSYNLVFAIDKNSSINIECLKVFINNDIYYLNDLYLNEDNDNYYYKLYTSNIDKKSNNDIEFLYYITCENNSLIQGSNFNYHIYIDEI